MMKYLLFFFLLPTASLFASQTVQVSSPDGSVVFEFKPTPQAPVYRVFYKGQPVISNSELGLAFSDHSFGKALKIKKVRSRERKESYALPVGKTGFALSHCQEAVITIARRKERIGTWER